MELARTADLTNDFITDEKIADPNPLPEIPGFYVLVRPVKPAEKVGSIVLPDSFKHDMAHLTNIGRVLKIGDVAFKDPTSKPGDPYYPWGSKFQKPWCKPGDYVVWKKFAGAKFLVKGVALNLLTDEEIMMVFQDPKDFNLMFNFDKLST